MQAADAAQQPTAAEQVAAHIERVAAVAAPFDCLLNIDNLVEMGCGSRTQIYKQVRAGSFPAPVRLGLARTRRRQSEVLAWMQALPRNSAPGLPPPIVPPVLKKREEKAKRARKRRPARNRPLTVPPAE